jgi:TPP-dependent pyruvate/acetoin dehydrogenase alpha subunit
VAIENEKLLNIYRVMGQIRTFENRFLKDKVIWHTPGTFCSYTGEEEIAARACANRRPGDYITSTPRGMGYTIAKGGKTDRIMAELFGKKTAYAKGKGGPIHIAEVDKVSFRGPGHLF